MSIKTGIEEVRGDIKRAMIAAIKEQLGPLLEEWGFATPYNIAIRYSIERLSYHVRITFTEGMTCVDWFVDEQGRLPDSAYEQMVEQLAADARIPIYEDEENPF